MENDFVPGADSEEIKCFLHGLGLITLDEYYAKLRQKLKRQRHSAKLTHEQIQRKIIESNLFKDNLSRNLPILLYPRKRTAFSLVLPRKRSIKEKVIKTSTLSTNESATTPTTPTRAISPMNNTDMIDYDQPLDLRLQSDRISKC